MRKLIIKDWGCELELANIPLNSLKSVYEPLGFTRNTKESVIVNDIDGILFTNDPTGEKLDWGGELNSKPQSKDELIQNLNRLIRDLNLTEKNLQSYYGNLDIHIKFDESTSYEDYVKFVNWIEEKSDEITRPFRSVFSKYPSKRINYKWNKTTLSWFKEHMNNCSSWEELKECYFIRPGSNLNYQQKRMVLARYKRPWINFAQMYQSQTIEIRLFSINNPAEIPCFFQYIEDIITSFNNQELKLCNPYPYTKSIEPPSNVPLKDIPSYKQYLKEIKNE